MHRNFINPIYSNVNETFYEGQITPPDEDSVMWRRSRDFGLYVQRQISKSFSRSQSNVMNDWDSRGQGLYSTPSHISSCPPGPLVRRWPSGNACYSLWRVIASRIFCGEMEPRPSPHYFIYKTKSSPSEKSKDEVVCYSSFFMFSTLFSVCLIFWIFLYCLSSLFSFVRMFFPPLVSLSLSRLFVLWYCLGFFYLYGFCMYAAAVRGRGVIVPAIGLLMCLCFVEESQGIEERCV